MKKIFIQDWLALKPYKKQTKSDVFYLKLSNDLKKVLAKEKPTHEIQKMLTDADLTELACFLASYLEDVVSGTNIWGSFVKCHKRMYGKELPFYAVDEEYFADEVNLADVRFLIWYHANTVQSGLFVGTRHDYVSETSSLVTDILQKAWEFAPDNEVIGGFYQIDVAETDFYKARELMEVVFFKTYLFYFDTQKELMRQNSDLNESFTSPNQVQFQLVEQREVMLSKHTTRLLNLKASEWVAEIIGDEHPLYTVYKGLSERLRAFFFYKGQDDSNVFLEHVATGLPFKLTKKSMDQADKLTKVDSVISFGLVRWMNEWWFTGLLFEASLDAAALEKERNNTESINAVRFLDPRTELTRQILETKQQAFFAFSGGQQIVFMPIARVREFVDDFATFYNANVGKKETKIKAAGKKLARKNYTEQAADIGAQDSGFVFYNPLSGSEMYGGINSAFPMEQNPYFQPEYSNAHVMTLLLEWNKSPELVRFCIENCQDKLPAFANETGIDYVDNLDFSLRFWKQQNYHTKPSISMVRQR